MAFKVGIPEAYTNDEMRDIIARSRDIMMLALQLQKDYGEHGPGLTHCLHVVEIAMADRCNDHLGECMLDVGKAVDELRRKVT